MSVDLSMGPRVGVFICSCGKNIGGFIDVPEVTEYARHLPGVIFAEHNMYTCSEDGLQSIRKAIKENQLNRVVVASCTPRTHAPLFQKNCEVAGINKYLFEFVNIRDQCSWVHMRDGKAATQKAKDLVRMGVAKAALLEPLTETEMDVIPEALVIGGGVAGMTAAENLAHQGIRVHLVEKEKELGGMLRRLDTVYPTDQKAWELIEPLIEEMEGNPRITVHMSSTVEDIRGFIGDFEVKVGGGLLKVGTIIVATGANVLEPDGLFGYGRYKNVVTQMGFEELLRSGRDLPRNIVMVQCAGARSPDEGWRPYCSKVCCMAAIKNAKKAKARDEAVDIHILHRDINATGTGKELYYHDVRGKGVKFVRYSYRTPPEVIDDGGDTVTHVRVHHETLNKDYVIPADLVVLSTPLVPNPDNAVLHKMLRVPLDKEGFYLEAHVKLRPLEFATDGIYICGTARFPVGINEAVADAYGAAAKAAIPMRTGRIRAEATTAQVDPDACSGCGTCESVCPYTAIRLKPSKAGKVAEINPMLCKGCGTCVPACPSRAITQKGFTDPQLVSQVLEATANGATGGWEPSIVGFCCNWCSYAGADMAGVSRFQYPANIRIVRTMCSGRVDPFWILRALLEGADGVFVSGCHPGDCHYISGNNYTAERVARLRETLADFGVDQSRLRLEWISASEGSRFAELVKEFTEEIQRLGPSPLRLARHGRDVCVQET